jgi:hypothetical protein
MRSSPRGRAARFLLLVITCILLLAEDARALIIDDFTVGAVTRTVTGQGSGTLPIVQNGLDPEHVLGGTRSLQLYYCCGPETGSVTGQVDTAEGGRFLYDGSSAGFQIEVDQLSYEFAEMDLGTGGNNTFEVQVLSADLSGRALQRFWVSVSSTVAGYDSVGFDLIPSETPYSLTIPFDAFDPEVIAGAIGVSLRTVNVPPNVTYAIGEFCIVPEPATCLPALGGFCLLQGRRRSRWGRAS